MINDIVLIVDHVWRPPPGIISRRGMGPRLGRPCEYMSCGRPRDEHARATTSTRGIRNEELP